MEALLKTVHVLSIVVWVGGMVFAHFFLRPAVTALEPPQRLTLMHEVLGRFFAAVLVVSLLAWGSGVWLLGRIARRVVQAGGDFNMPSHWWLMAVGGTLMLAIFMHIRFALFKRLRRAVIAQDWPAGGAAMAQVRQWVAVNLAIGLAIVVAVLLGGS